MKKIISITLAIILLLGAVVTYSCSSCSKTSATKLTEESSSDDASSNQLSSNDKTESVSIEDTTEQTTTLNNDTTTEMETEEETTITEVVEEETTTKPPVKEETTTKPVVKEEKTTTKPIKQTTSKKENQTKPVEEETTTKPTVDPNQFTYEIWDEPVTYIFSDDIDEQINMYALPSKDSQVRGWHTRGGMDVEIIGICKENGWYVVAGDEYRYVSNEYKIIKKASIDDSFEDYESMEDYIDGLYIDNPYMGKLYLYYPGEYSVSGEEVKIYDNRKIEDLLYIYSYIMPRYVVHYYNPEEGYYGTETIEELIKLTFGENSIWTVQHYKNGEALAKYYGLDFHSDVEALKSWSFVDFDNLAYEETYQKVYCSRYVGFNSDVKEKPHASGRFFLEKELEEYGGFSTIGGHFYITKKYIDWPWYEILYIESETNSPGDRVIVAYISVEDFEYYYQEGNLSFDPIEE